MTVKEHCERVRFDPKLVPLRLPKNGFRLIHPMEAPGEDPDLYLKVSRKAFDIFRMTTGTLPKSRIPDVEPKPKPKKKKKKKAKPKKTEAN